MIGAQGRTLSGCRGGKAMGEDRSAAPLQPTVEEGADLYAEALAIARGVVNEVHQIVPLTAQIVRLALAYATWRLAASSSAPAQSTEDFTAKYFELLYAVGNHYPGESRHATALRYIKRAEALSGVAASAAPPAPSEQAT